MPNGRPGDHPLSDIILHGMDIYSPAVVKLVEQIMTIADGDERDVLADLLLNKYNESLNPNVNELERELTAMRDAIRAKAKGRR